MLPKAVLVAFVQNVTSKDSSMGRTFRNMGWQEFLRKPCPSTDLMEVLGEFICHHCLDEDGRYNEFQDPIVRVLPAMLEHWNLKLDLSRAAKLKTLLDSGKANPASVAAMLRSLTR